MTRQELSTYAKQLMASTVAAVRARSTITLTDNEAMAILGVKPLYAELDDALAPDVTDFPKWLRAQSAIARAQRDTTYVGDMPAAMFFDQCAITYERMAEGLRVAGDRIRELERAA